MFRRITLAVAAFTIAASAFAFDTAAVQKSYELKDGAKVHVFKDGKMGMEDKFGRAVPMKEGMAMETKDGQKILMKGNEVWRTDTALRHDARP